MKKCFFVFVLGCLSAFANIPVIGEKASHFSVETTKGKVDFPEHYAGKWMVLFSYPSAFTPLCTEEMKKVHSMIDNFESLQAELVGLSIFSVEDHKKWLESMPYGKKITLISDSEKKMGLQYGMFHPITEPKTIRSVYIIDPKGVIRAMWFYPSKTGRNFDEILRVLASIQATDREGGYTGPLWKEGEKPARLP
ncbi:MAG: redoxin domain-containing protein [Chlamydiota bacterium]